MRQLLLRMLPVWVLLLTAGGAWGLEPDEILLLANKNIPESVQLAQFYATARQIPEGRILALPLPVGEEIAFAGYEENVVPAVREFLRKNNLQEKVKCIVTFHAVPLRISPRKQSAQDKEELAQLEEAKRTLLQMIRRKISEIAGEQEQEKLAKAEDPEELARLAERAVQSFSGRMNEMSAEDRQRAGTELMERIDFLAGPAALVQLMSKGTRTPEGNDKLAELSERVKSVRVQLNEAQEQRYSADARTRARTLAAQGFGRIEQLRVLLAQMAYLKPEESGAAFDNELALLWWGPYPRSRWHPNLLNYHFLVVKGAPPTLMVMRLDAPQPGLVRDMILSSLKAERDGLHGKVVLDSRGIAMAGKDAQQGGYGWYDESIRNLAEIVRTKTKLQMLHEESPQLLGPNAANDVAMYCGWYSVRNYVPCCRYNPGAVGYHVASYELISLKQEGEKGWVKGMLNDGVAATLGAVGEPYLTSFPLADEFFPLLMTGKLTLAEVYWKTTPMTSWMISMIGDPLYVPYKTNPPLAVEDLPQRLKSIFVPPTTLPATNPGGERPK